MDMELYMRKALALARDAGERGEIPVGCVIADGQGNIIGRGANSRQARGLVSGHAEMAALEMAAQALGDWRLTDCTAFVTLEPCPMCAGAMINARLGKLVYGAREPRFGSCASVLNLFAEGYPGRTAVYGGVLAGECEALLSEFFRALREE